MRPIEIRDIRTKEKYSIDDAYLNGFARLLKPTATAIYNSLCRHADLNQSSFPSLKLLSEQHGISVKSAQRAIKKLREHNIIAYEQVRSKSGKWLRNKYYLLDKKNWTLTTVGQKRLSDNHRTFLKNTVGQNRPSKDTHNNINNNNNNSNYYYYYASKDAEASPLVKKNNSLIKKEKTYLTTTEPNTIASLINLFKPINPSTYKLFSNTSQRKAMDRLVTKHGEARIRWIMERLPGIVSQPYAPVVTTPYQLEAKLGDLLLFLERNKNKGGGILDARNVR